MPYAVEAAFAIGNALEPFIVDFLQSRGLDIWETGEEQKVVEASLPEKVRAKGWRRVGHLDGVIPPQKVIDPSLLAELPPVIVQELAEGRDVILEVKSMKADHWAKFKMGGFQADPLLAKYLYQSQGYLDGYPAARYELVVAVNKGPGHARAYQAIKRDEEIIAEGRDWVGELAAYLEKGELPPPDYDGSAPECQLCPHAHRCPARERFRSAPMEQEGVGPERMATLDDLAAQYIEARDLEMAAGAAKKELKERIEAEMADLGTGRVQTDLFRLGRSEVAGRMALDTSSLNEFLAEYNRNTKDFQKRGRGYTTLRVSSLGEEGEESE
jgi:hypothetical protein